MSHRHGLWQRLCGACVVLLLIVATEALIPDTANAASTPKPSRKSLTPRHYIKYKTIVTCKKVHHKKVCSSHRVPVLVPVASTTTTPATTTATTPNGIIPSFTGSSPQGVNDPSSELVESLPGVLFATNRPSTTTTTTTAPTTTITTTTTTRPATTTTTTPPAPTGTPGPSNPSALVTSGPMTITTNGAVVQNVNVQGQITIAANNVTLRNFRANNIYKNPGNGGLLMEYGEIHGEQNYGADGVVWSDYTARYLDVHNVFDAFKAHGNVLIENCWVHDLKFRTGSDAGAGGYTHNDGVQVSSGSNVTVRNSTFERNLGNAAIFIDADQGAISNVLIEGNRLGGGGFTLYSIQSRSAPQFGRPTNVTIRNNVFTEEHHYDYATIAPTGTTFTGNTKAIGGAVVARIDNF